MQIVTAKRPVGDAIGIGSDAPLSELGGFCSLFGREIRAAFDQKGVYVFQAFCPTIADHALEKGTFGEGFGRNRMTWIKPSFGWMLYRSDYASKVNQERILRIQVSHEGFGELLRNAVPSEFDPRAFVDQASWKNALQNSRARVQWDPDRDLALKIIERTRAIQIGIGRTLVPSYVDKWIVGITDVTKVAQGIRDEILAGRSLGGVMAHPFPEKIYPVDRDIRVRLGMIE